MSETLETLENTISQTPFRTLPQDSNKNNSIHAFIGYLYTKNLDIESSMPDLLFWIKVSTPACSQDLGRLYIVLRVCSCIPCFHTYTISQYRFCFKVKMASPKLIFEDLSNSCRATNLYMIQNLEPAKSTLNSSFSTTGPEKSE